MPACSASPDACYPQPHTHGHSATHRNTQHAHACATQVGASFNARASYIWNQLFPQLLQQEASAAASAGAAAQQQGVAAMIKSRMRLLFSQPGDGCFTAVEDRVNPGQLVVQLEVGELCDRARSVVLQGPAPPTRLLPPGMATAGAAGGSASGGAHSAGSSRAATPPAPSSQTATRAVAAAPAGPGQAQGQARQAELGAETLAALNVITVVPAASCAAIHCHGSADPRTQLAVAVARGVAMQACTDPHGIVYAHPGMLGVEEDSVRVALTLQTCRSIHQALFSAQQPALQAAMPPLERCLSEWPAVFTLLPAGQPLQLPAVVVNLSGLLQSALEQVLTSPHASTVEAEASQLLAAFVAQQGGGATVEGRAGQVLQAKLRGEGGLVQLLLDVQQVGVGLFSLCSSSGPVLLLPKLWFTCHGVQGIVLGVVYWHGWAGCTPVKEDQGTGLLSARCPHISSFHLHPLFTAGL